MSKRDEAQEVFPPLGHRWPGWPTKRRALDDILDEQDIERAEAAVFRDYCRLVFDVIRGGWPVRSTVSVRRGS